MTKLEFLASLRDRISDLPQEDATERLNFYAEMIDDRMEEGLSEEDAVLAIGSLDDIVEQHGAELQRPKNTKKKTAPKRCQTAWKMVLLAVGSPIWLSLLIAAVAVVISLYASLWAVIVSLWAAFVALVGCAVGCLTGGAVFALSGHALSGLATVGAALVCAGLSIFAFFGCRAATKGARLLSKKLALGIAHCLTRKEDV